MNHNRKCLLFSVIILLLIGLFEPAFAQKNSKAQKGTASWYGSKYHGRATSSGERYNKNEMTAAHNGLPFGTKVKVTNLANNKSVILRINDRGPFKGERIIDVSEAAAKKLSFRDAGLSKVKVEVIEWPETELALAEPSESALFTIQAGAYASPDYASEVIQQIKAFDKHLFVEVTEDKVNGRKVHRILAGRFENKEAAEAFNELLAEEGLEGKVFGM